MKCDICGESLSRKEQKIYEEISNPEEVCYCSIAKRIVKAENGKKHK